MAAVGHTARRSSLARVGFAAATLTFGVLFASLGAVLLVSSGQSEPSPSAGRVEGIPSAYLAAYEQAAARFKLGPNGWSILAGIGEVESDHGRSTASGVSSGQNFHGCCAGPMQIHNGFGAGTGTWGAYAVDGNGDGRLDIYDIADAAPTAARYLRASGAPSDWRAAIFAYNHDSSYVARVLDLAEKYQAAAMPAAPANDGTTVTGDGRWLADVPGFPGERCDARIVADVVAITVEFGLRLTDCFGGAPHETNGEHPLGLAADLVPVDGDWSRTARTAAAFGWAPACAANGCPGRGPLRVVLYNGFPGHGDPAHSGTPHLHLSWQHAVAAPFSRAASVRVLLARTGATTAGSEASSSVRWRNDPRAGRKENQ